MSRLPAVNARFRSRTSPTGVDRTAAKLIAQLDGLDELAPKHDGRLGTRNRVGQTAWEHLVLPLRVLRRPLLLSLANSGPALARNHVVMIHDISHLDHPEWFSPAYRMKATTLNRLWKHTAHSILTVSEFSKHRIQERLGVDPERIVVIPNGVDPTQPNFETRRRSKVVALATREPRKNLSYLLDAWPAVVAADSEAQLRVIGAAGSSSIFSDSTQTSMSPPNVEYLGYLSDQQLDEELRSASLLVSVSKYEGFNLPPAEALVRGTPVLLSDIPVHREIYEGLATFCDLDDPASLGQALIRSSGGAPLPRATVEEATRRFSWPDAGALLSQHLAQLVGHPLSVSSIATEAM